jgi:uncharacterized protein (TIGR02271 family)
MLENLGGSHDRNDREMAGRDRDALIRERMQAHGLSQEEATRIVLSEEQLAVGKREVQTGEVGIHKHVETERVHTDVPLRHEEVDIERRPISGGYSAAGATGATIGGDEEIRVQLHAEEAVVEKRVVPTEEILVRKREVVENESIDTELRREHVEVDRTNTTMDRGVRDDRLDGRM